MAAGRQPVKFRIGDFVYAVVGETRKPQGRGFVMAPIQFQYGTVVEREGDKYSVYPYPDGVHELWVGAGDLRKAYLTHYGPVFQRIRTRVLSRGGTP